MICNPQQRSMPFLLLLLGDYKSKPLGKENPCYTQIRLQKKIKILEIKELHNERQQCELRCTGTGPGYNLVLLPSSSCKISNNSTYHSYSNILSPKQEINSFSRSLGKSQYANALHPILLTLSGMKISDRESQPKNVNSAILVTLFGITTLVKKVQLMYLLLVDYQYYTL